MVKRRPSAVRNSAVPRCRSDVSGDERDAALVVSEAATEEGSELGAWSREWVVEEADDEEVACGNKKLDRAERFMLSFIPKANRTTRTAMDIPMPNTRADT